LVHNIGVDIAAVIITGTLRVGSAGIGRKEVADTLSELLGRKPSHFSRISLSGLLLG
jgi:hypothetical protein